MGGAGGSGSSAGGMGGAGGSSSSSAGGSGSGAGGSGAGNFQAVEACACTPCSAHGTCRYDAGSTSCQCDPGYVANGLECIASPANAGGTFYVSPTGNNANMGTSPNAPFKTIAYALGKVGPGGVIMLEGGATFTETITIPTGFGGQPGNPIRITSNPSNRAKFTIASGQNGISLYNSSNLTFENLVFVGPGAASTTKDGVSAMTDGQARGLIFRNIEVSGFYRGLFVVSWGGATGFDEVLVDSVIAHDNRDAGISTYAEVVGGHRHVVVRRSLAYGNLGDPAVNRPSGDGIVLGGVADSLIEHCVAHGNGGAGTNSAGPVGIWTYNATRVTIQYNESYDNHAIFQDGDGFDLDVGVTDSVMQYNYAHDNDGAGFILCQTGTVPWNNNVVRYNVSVNDARKKKMGAITWCSFGGGAGMKNSYVYGNTVLSGYAPALNPAMEAGSTGHRVFNNIFVTSNGEPLVWVWGSGTTSGLMTFTGNMYWTTGGTANFEGSTSLDAWRTAKGQEKLNGANVGYYVDPQMVEWGPSCAMNGGTAVPGLAPYRLGAGSPAIDAGLSPLLFVSDPGSHDVWGTAIPQGASFDIGAEEYGL
jgi:hypothetical protein